VAQGELGRIPSLPDIQAAINPGLSGKGIQQLELVFDEANFAAMKPTLPCFAQQVLEAILAVNRFIGSGGLEQLVFAFQVES
jgi:hypothetical protein